MKIFYFTGTGNSLAVARRFQGELISIPQIAGREQTVYEDEAIGIVFPLYCLNPPKMVREFLRKTKFKTKYLFAVATYGFGTGAAMPNLQKTVKKYGYRFDYMNTLLMVDNFLPNFEINEEIAKLPVKKTEECLAQIVSDVNERRRSIPKATAADKAVSAVCAPLMKKQDKGETAGSFLVNEDCVRCGTENPPRPSLPILPTRESRPQAVRRCGGPRWWRVSSPTRNTKGTPSSRRSLQWISSPRGRRSTRAR